MNNSSPNLKNEDNTFNVLKRPSWEEMCILLEKMISNIIFKNTPPYNTTEEWKKIIDNFYEENGWSKEEVEKILNKHNHFDPS